MSACKKKANESKISTKSTSLDLGKSEGFEAESVWTGCGGRYDEKKRLCARRAMAIERMKWQYERNKDKMTPEERKAFQRKIATREAKYTVLDGGSAKRSRGFPVVLL